MDRISRSELYMQTARLFGMRSTCPRASVGAIAIEDNRIVATGYVGAPVGMPHCTDVGCEIQDQGCIRTVHAEANLVSFAASGGISLRDAIIYTTLAPCYTCAKLLINVGIESLVFDEAYRDTRGNELLRTMGIEVIHYEPTSSETLETDS
jgi:dCMP deaminase